MFFARQKKKGLVWRFFIFLSRIFSVLKKIRDMFSLKQPDQSGWKNICSAASVAAPPLPQASLNFSPHPLRRGGANISSQTKGVFTCVRFTSQNQRSYYFSQ